MAIKTSPFSGWRLSGEDAAEFLRQFEDTTPNPLAQQAIVDGQRLAKEYIEKGYAFIYPIIKKV